VVALIGRGRARVDEIDHAIVERDDDQLSGGEPWPPWPLNKHDKKIAQSLGRAVGRLEKQLQRSDALGVVERALLHVYFEFDEWQAQLKYWRKCFEAFAGEPQEDGVTQFPNIPRNLPNIPRYRPLGPPRPSAERFVRKRSAVATAAEILQVHGLRPTATQKSATRNASLFCRVAAAVYGDPRADLYHQCRIYIEESAQRRRRR
jgi:hypothetical protein